MTLRLNGSSKIVGLAAIGVVFVTVAFFTVAPAGATAQSDSDGVIHTDYFDIEYEDGTQAEAEQVASFADEYHQILFQRFGVAPADRPVTVRIVPDGETPCGDPGCYQQGLIVISTGDRDTFYHELVHHLQDQTFGVGGSSLTPEVTVEGTAQYLMTSPEEIAATASFREEDIYFHSDDAAGDQYNDLALFPEYVLHEYGRAGFDILYTADHPRELESVADEDYQTIIDNFYQQLDAQQSRLQNGGAPLVGFTYTPQHPSEESEVTFDARTPEAIEKLGRSWYNGEAESFEWDFDGDGTIDATGPIVTRTIENPADTTVTLYVTIDGQRYRAKQDLLDDSMAIGSGEAPQFSIDGVTMGEEFGVYEPAELPEATAGEDVSLSVRVTNRGGLGSQTVDVSFDGSDIASEEIELRQGETQGVGIKHQIPTDLETGKHTYTIQIGTQTFERTIYIKPTGVEISWGSASVPNGVEGAMIGGQIEPGKRIQLVVDVSVRDDSVGTTETVQVSFDDQVVGEKEVQLTSGTQELQFEFTVPSEPGTYQLGASLAESNAGIDVSGFSRRITVQNLQQSRKVQLQSKDGPCEAQLSAVRIAEVYKSDRGWVAGANADSITIGDRVKVEIRGLRNDECSLVPELPVTVAGESKLVREENMRTRKYLFTFTHRFDEPGTHQIRSDDTVLTSVNVAVDRDSSESSEVESDADKDSSESGNENTESTGDSESTDGNNESNTADSSVNTPGFDVPVAVFAVAVFAILATKRHQ